MKTRSPQTTAAGFDALGGGLVWIACLDAAVSSNASSGVSTTTPSARIHQLMPRSFSPARTPDRGRNAHAALGVRRSWASAAS